MSQPLKPRPDAFPPVPENNDVKAIQMATTIAEMADWDRYPTYGTYVAMMNRWVEQYPSICRLDTIGTSVNGRLILCMVIKGENAMDNNPEFFYSSTMHGDEVTGYVMMLHLIDTLLSGYGSNQQYTDLIDSVDIYINPLSNPDGTYFRGDNTVSGSIRYNANFVDLNRNYPDPFGTAPLDPEQPENTAMIAYFTNHHFLLSANLHGGSEVMNYPWDSFTSYERPHPQAEWWKAVSKRYVDTCRRYNSRIFTNVNSQGFIAGGDWYVIYNGRQDYFNYYHHTYELTMEVSTSKKLPTEQLQRYWNIQSHSLINYIKEVFNAPADQPEGIAPHVEADSRVYPNPTRGWVTVETPQGFRNISLSNRPAGVYIIPVEGHPVKITKL
jgi:hypothetical protein